MKIEKLDLLILGVFIITIFVWFYFDMLQQVWTPLTDYGMNHWVSELLLIFLLAYDICDNPKITKGELDVIIIILFLYPFLYYIFTGGTIAEYVFGFGAGCIFSGIFLLGVWYGKKKLLSRP